MVIGRLVIPMKPQKKKIVKFDPRPRVWKLIDEETARLFTREMRIGIWSEPRFVFVGRESL